MLTFLEKTFVVIALLFFSGSMTPTDLAENQHSPVINRLNSLLQLAIFPLLAVFIAVHSQRMWQAIRSSGWLIALCALATFSAAWSPIPGFTFRRGIILCGATLFAAYLGSCFDDEEQVVLLKWMLLIQIVGSFAIVAVLPQYGLSHGGHWGDWKGLFGHKNSLGRIAAFGVLLFVTAKPKAAAWARLLLLIGSAALLVLSGSATSLMTALFVLCLYPVLQILRVNTRNTLPLWAAIAPLVIFVLAVVLINYSMLLESVGRDPTLTGRTQLWAAVVDTIMRRPWLGYGYASFWRYQGVDLASVISTIHWAAPHSHDAYLDLCLDLGLIGMVVFLIGAAATVSRAVKSFQQGDRPSARWPLVFLLYFFMYNLTESELLRSHSTLWLFYVSVYVSLAVRRYEQPDEADEALETDLEPELA